MVRRPGASIIDLGAHTNKGLRPLHGILQVRRNFSIEYGNINLFILSPMVNKQSPGSFVSVDVTRRTKKSKFFQPIDTVIDWSMFDQELYKVGKCSVIDAAGRPAHSLLWYSCQSKTATMCLNTLISYAAIAVIFLPNVVLP